MSNILTKVKRDKYWAKPNGNLKRIVCEKLDMEWDDENFAEKFIESQCIKVTDTFFVHIDIYQEYLKIEENNLPCGYAWFDITDLKQVVVGLKNGQASTGNVRARVTSFETRGAQVLLDVYDDAIFKKSGYDQKLNKEIEKDYKIKYGISVQTGKTTRTKENVLVPRSLLFDFPQLKRNTISRLHNKPVNLRNFNASTSHEECLTKLTTNTLSQYFLLDCVMRFGKSFIFFEYIKRNYVDKGINKIHTSFCHDTKTVDGWIDKADIYYNGIFDCVILKDDKSFNFNKKVKKNTIVFISQQLLHSNKDFSNPNEIQTKPLASLININVKSENTFVDEVHQYFSPQWKSYFESITKNKIILASGTAAKIKLQYPDLFDIDNTHTDTLIDLKNRFFKDFGIEIVTTIKRIKLSDLGSEFTNMTNLQSTDEKNEKLVYPGLVDKFWATLFTGFRTSPMTPEQISKENPSHFPIYCDTVEFARAGFNFLKSHPELGITPILVAGHNSGRTVKTETKLKEFIKDESTKGNSTAMFTCGSMIQGISVEGFKDLINISTVSTYEMFYQFFGRGWEIDSKKMKDKKVHITMWDYNPQRTLKVASQFILSMAMTNGIDIPAAFKMYFEIHHMFDYVPNGSRFDKIDINKIEAEIRELVNPHVITRGCKARLVTNTRPSVMKDISAELLELLLQTNGSKHKNKVNILESYKSNLNKQKTNHSIKSHDLDIPKISTEVQDVWQSAIDGLSFYTELIPLVTEVMFTKGIVKSKNILELLKHSQNEFFINGFQFPNKIVSKQFSEYILKYGDADKINLKVDNSKNLIPNIIEYLGLSEKEFLVQCDIFDEMFKYSGVDTQLSVRRSFNIIKKSLKKDKFKIGTKFHVPYTKSGSINLSLAYLLYNNSKKYFGKQLTKEQIIKSISFEDENAFFNEINTIMGFTQSTKTGKDFILINPPYKGGLHIQIFNKAFEKLNDGGTLICLHPSTPFINRKPTKDDGKTQRIKEIVSKYKTRLTLVDGNTMFDAGFFTPLSITRVEKVLDEKIEVVYSHIDSTNKEVNVYDKLDDIFIHGNDIVLKIKDKIFSKMNESLEDCNGRTASSKKYNFYIKTTSILGHIPKNGKLNPDFFCLIYKSDESNFDKVISDGFENGYNYIGCDTKEKSINMFEYFKTKFVRFSISIYKLNQNLHRGELMAVPYMDFSQEWTDEKLFEYFDLDPEEIDFINTYIQNWYERDFN